MTTSHRAILQRPRANRNGGSTVMTSAFSRRQLVDVGDKALTPAFLIFVVGQERTNYRLMQTQTRAMQWCLKS